MKAKVKFAEFSVMAKSKTGGTRAYIRGRIGSDVYSVGKTSDGKKQQVVRSLAETVSNPRTESQMFGRMIMSSIMQAVSALKPIIDHSFDGLPTGQPSISEFIRRNYALVKADALAHPASGNSFGLNKYQEKGIKGGDYIVSNGSLNLPESVSTTNSGIEVENLTADFSVAKYRELMGVGNDGYVTAVLITDDGKAAFVRLTIDPSAADDTVVSGANVATIFKVESNVTAVVSYDDGSVKATATLSGTVLSRGLIGSSVINGVRQHSTAQLIKVGTPDFAADVALPTYPVGTEQFLDGGDL